MVRYIARRTVLAAAATALAGCASGTEQPPTATQESENPALGDVEQTGDLQLVSPDFEDGEAIPGTYGRDAENVNPPLAVENIPGGAASLTLILDDPDAVDPAGTVWLHWLVWNVPTSRTRPTSATSGRPCRTTASPRHS